MNRTCHVMNMTITLTYCIFTGRAEVAVWCESKLCRGEDCPTMLGCLLAGTHTHLRLISQVGTITIAMIIMMIDK